MLISPKKRKLIREAEEKWVEKGESCPKHFRFGPSRTSCINCLFAKGCLSFTKIERELQEKLAESAYNEIPLDSEMPLEVT